MLWLSEVADDVESDLSVFHRIEEMEQMPSPRFVRLATRLPAYSGAVSARLRLRAAAQRTAEDAPQAQGIPAGNRPAAGYRRGAPSSFWTRAAVPAAVT